MDNQNKELITIPKELFFNLEVELTRFKQCYQEEFLKSKEKENKNKELIELINNYKNENYRLKENLDFEVKEKDKILKDNHYLNERLNSYLNDEQVMIYSSSEETKDILLNMVKIIESSGYLNLYGQSLNFPVESDGSSIKKINIEFSYGNNVKITIGDY